MRSLHVQQQARQPQMPDVQPAPGRECTWNACAANISSSSWHDGVVGMWLNLYGGPQHSCLGLCLPAVISIFGSLETAEAGCSPGRHPRAGSLPIESDGAVVEQKWPMSLGKDDVCPSWCRSRVCVRQRRSGILYPIIPSSSLGEKGHGATVPHVFSYPACKLYRKRPSTIWTRGLTIARRNSLRPMDTSDLLDGPLMPFV